MRVSGGLICGSRALGRLVDGCGDGVNGWVVQAEPDSGLATGEVVRSEQQPCEGGASSASSDNSVSIGGREGSGFGGELEPAGEDLHGWGAVRSEGGPEDEQPVREVVSGAGGDVPAVHQWYVAEAWSGWLCGVDLSGGGE